MNEIQGLDKLTSLLADLSARMADVSPVMDEIVEIGLSSFQQNFQLGGRFGSSPFGGGAARWPVSGRAARQGGRTLLDTAHLASSITAEITGTTVTWGTNDVRGATHQFGRRNAPGGADPDGDGFAIPPRPFLVLQDIDIEDMIDALIDYYSKVIGK
jgi:phage gpG-like protein